MFKAWSFNIQRWPLLKFWVIGSRKILFFGIVIEESKSSDAIPNTKLIYFVNKIEKNKHSSDIIKSYTVLYEIFITDLLYTLWISIYSNSDERFRHLVCNRRVASCFNKTNERCSLHVIMIMPVCCHQLVLIDSVPYFFASICFYLPFHISHDAFQDRHVDLSICVSWTYCLSQM